MRRRCALRPAPALVCLAALVLPACTHLQEAPPKSPRVSGELAGVECGGETPERLAPAAGKVLDPDAEAIAAWLEALGGDGEEASRLRAYLRCLADRNAVDDRSDPPPDRP